MQSRNHTPRRGRRLVGAAVLLGLGLLATPAAVQAQQKPAGAQAQKQPKPALTPADSAACAQVITYAFSHTEVLEQAQQLQANPKAKAFLDQPDSARGLAAAAIAKGQGDTLKAMTRRVLGEETAKGFDGFVDLVVAFPDSIRNAVATLMKGGRLLTCTQ